MNVTTSDQENQQTAHTVTTTDALVGHVRASGGGTAAAISRPSPVDHDPDPGDERDVQSKTIFSVKPEDFLHDAEKHKYLMRAADGSWDAAAPMMVGAFDTLLMSFGLQKKQLDGYKARIHSFNKRKAFFNKPTEVIVEHEGITYFNTYSPGKVIPVPGAWDDIRALVLNLAGGDLNAYEFFMDWIALPIQKVVYEGNPFKMGTSIVLQGDQGSGKGTLHLILREIYGKKNVLLMDQDMMDGRFHEQLMDKLFVTANEVMSNTNRSGQTANKIKMWVTDPVVRIEGKFEAGEEFDNHFNVIFASNDERPVIVEKGDRRFTVFHSEKFDKAVAKRIHNDIAGDQKQVGAFFDHLLRRQVGIAYGDLFDTEAKRKMTLASAPSEIRFAQEIKEEGWLSVSKNWIDDARQDRPRVATIQYENEIVVLSGTLQEVYREWCKRNGLRATTARYLLPALQGEFKDRTGKPILESDSQRIGGVVQRFWRGLPLDPPGEVINFPRKNNEAPAEPAKSSDAGEFSA